MGRRERQSRPRCKSTLAEVLERLALGAHDESDPWRKERLQRALRRSRLSPERPVIMSWRVPEGFNHYTLVTGMDPHGWMDVIDTRGFSDRVPVAEVEPNLLDVVAVAAR